MAIKVKHDGNATSRIAAGAAGGKGRRRSEDAKALLQIASQEGIASRRIQTPQMVQAHATAPGSAPLVNAPSGGGGASLMSAPSIPQPHPVQNRGGGGGGGGTVPRMEPKRNRSQPGTNGERLEEVGNGKYRLVTADGSQVLREYNKDEFNDLVRRGSNGVSLSDRDATAFTRWKSSQGILTEEEKRQAAEDAKIAEAEKDRQLKLEMQQRQHEHENYQSEIDYRNKVEDAARRQAEIEANRKAELQGKKDLFDYQLTQQQKQEANKLSELYAQIDADNNFGEEEKVELKRQALAKLLGIQPVPTLKGPTAQEEFDKRVVNVNGKEGYIGAKGDFIPFDDGSEDKLEAKRMDALRSRADKYELELMKPYKVIGPRGQEVTKERTPEEIDAIMRRKFPELYQTAGTTVAGQEQPPAQPTEQPTEQPPPTPEERKKKWGNFAD